MKTSALDSFPPQKSRPQRGCRNDRGEASPVLTITAPTRWNLRRELLPFGMCSLIVDGWAGGVKHAPAARPSLGSGRIIAARREPKPVISAARRPLICLLTYNNEAWPLDERCRPCDSSAASGGSVDKCSAKRSADNPMTPVENATPPAMPDAQRWLTRPV